MNITTADQCARAEAVCWKAISAIHARLRWLKWHAVIDSFDCSTKLSEVKKAAHYLSVAEAKVSEELAEFRRLKAIAEHDCYQSMLESNPIGAAKEWRNFRASSHLGKTDGSHEPT